MPHDFSRNIREGWDVYASDGEKLGSVQDVYDNYFTVEQGLLFKTTQYIPFTAITDMGDEAIHLNATSDMIESQGWDQAPPTTAGTTRTAGMTSTRGEDVTEVDRESMEIPVAEEELRARTREEEKGRVRVHKDVVEEQESIEVPVREEEVHVRRVRDAGGSTDVPSDAFQERDYEIPVRGEEVEVDKEAVVRGHVDISKEAREHEERFTDTVRREEVDVEAEGDIEDVGGRRGRRRGRRADSDRPYDVGDADEAERDTSL